MRKRFVVLWLVLLMCASVGCQIGASLTPTLEKPGATVPPTLTQVAPTNTVAPTNSQISATDHVLYLVDTYDENRDAAQDLSKALEMAQDAGKKVILEVGGDWCPDCIALGKFINSHQDIFQEMANRYFMVKINLSTDNKNEEFLSQYPTLEWVPHFYILESDGTLIESLDTRELMTDGAFDPEKFWAFLE